MYSMNKKYVHIKSFVAAAVFFLIVDGLWLGVLMSDAYAGWVGHLLAPEPMLLPAIVFYLVYPVVLYALALAAGRDNIRSGVVHGALIGMLVYGGYELTNMATLPEWPLAMVLADTLWGTLLSGVTVFVGYRAQGKKWGK